MPRAGTARAIVEFAYGVRLVSHGALDDTLDAADLERRTTELLQRLIQFNTVNPPGNEQAAQEFLKEMLEGAGFDVRAAAVVEGRPNLIASMKAESDGPDPVPARPRGHRAGRPRASGRSTRGRAS